MKHKIIGILGMTALLGGCAGQPQQYSMDQYGGGSPQQVTFPNGTVFSGASGRQASSLAQIMVDSNNNMKDYEALQATSNKNLQTTDEVLKTLQQVSQRQDAMSSKNLQTSQHALSVIEHLSQSQGTGEITQFFPTGSATLASSGLQYDRLINLIIYRG